MLNESSYIRAVHDCKTAKELEKVNRDRAGKCSRVKETDAHVIYNVKKIEETFL